MQFIIFANVSATEPKFIILKFIFLISHRQNFENWWSRSSHWPSSRAVSLWVKPYQLQSARFPWRPPAFQVTNAAESIRTKKHSRDVRGRMTCCSREDVMQSEVRGQRLRVWTTLSDVVLHKHKACLTEQMPDKCKQNTAKAALQKHFVETLNFRCHSEFDPRLSKCPWARHSTPGGSWWSVRESYIIYFFEVGSTRHQKEMEMFSQDGSWLSGV